jgi:hypothetical protein
LIRVVREVDDKPAAGVTLNIRFPDGSVDSRTTDANGEVRLEGIPGDSFKVLSIGDEDARLAIADSSVSQGVA